MREEWAEESNRVRSIRLSVRFALTYGTTVCVAFQRRMMSDERPRQRKRQGSYVCQSTAMYFISYQFIHSFIHRMGDREKDREYVHTHSHTMLGRLQSTQIACCCCMVNNLKSGQCGWRWHNTDWLSIRYLRTLFLSCCLHLPLCVSLFFFSSSSSTILFFFLFHSTMFRSSSLLNRVHRAACYLGDFLSFYSSPSLIHSLTELPFSTLSKRNRNDAFDATLPISMNKLFYRSISTTNMSSHNMHIDWERQRKNLESGVRHACVPVVVLYVFFIRSHHFLSACKS